MTTSLEEALRTIRTLRKQNRRLRMAKPDSYESYLRSPHWLELRRTHLDNTAFCCACKSKSRLVLHHIYYSRLGSERTGDLIVLCSNCHQKLHDFLDSKYPGDSTGAKVRRTQRLFEEVFEVPWQPQFEVRMPGRSQGRPRGLTKAQKKARQKQHRATRPKALSNDADRPPDTTGHKSRLNKGWLQRPERVC